MGKEIKKIGDIGENLLGFHGIKKAVDPLGIMGGAFGARNIVDDVTGKQGAAMPTTDDEAVRAARRRKASQMQQRGGRESTILTQASERLGG